MMNKYSIQNLLTVENFKKAIERPKLALEVGKKSLWKYYSRSTLDNPMNILAEDWDNLILLDACRYDTFCQHCDIDGKLSRKVSPGTSSWEFMQESFLGGKNYDTVYITGNPHTPKLAGQSPFFKIVHVPAVRPNGVEWQYKPHETTQFVPPENIISEYKTQFQSFPHKKFILHFMQPHLPFIGKSGYNIYSKLIDNGFEDGLKKYSVLQLMDGRWVKNPQNILSDSEVRRAYSENVIWALHYAKKALSSLVGRTIITSDHANLLGESVLGRKRYGHVHDLHTPNLVHVPHLIIDGKSRRNIVEDNSQQRFLGFDEEYVERQLQALGYKN